MRVEASSTEFTPTKDFPHGSGGGGPLRPDLRYHPKPLREFTLSTIPAATLTKDFIFPPDNGHRDSELISNGRQHVNAIFRELPEGVGQGVSSRIIEIAYAAARQPIKAVREAAAIIDANSKPDDEKLLVQAKAIRDNRNISEGPAGTAPYLRQEVAARVLQGELEAYFPSLNGNKPDDETQEQTLRTARTITRVFTGEFLHFEDINYIVDRREQPHELDELYMGGDLGDHEPQRAPHSPRSLLFPRPPKPEPRNGVPKETDRNGKYVVFDGIKD